MSIWRPPASSATTTRSRREPCWPHPPVPSASIWCMSHVGLHQPQSCPGNPKNPSYAPLYVPVHQLCVHSHCLPRFPAPHMLGASNPCAYIPTFPVPCSPKQCFPSPVMNLRTKPLPCSCTPPSPAALPAPLLPLPQEPGVTVLCPSRASLVPTPCQCGTEAALLFPAWPTSCTSPLLATATAQGPTRCWRALWPASPAVAPCPAAPACGQPSSTWWVTCCRASASSWLPPSSTSRCPGWTAPLPPVGAALPVPSRVGCAPSLTETLLPAAPVQDCRPHQHPLLLGLRPWLHHHNPQRCRQGPHGR